MKELVALATEHGILTPYTSFLADETSDVRDLSQNRGRALDEARSTRAKHPAASASSSAARS